MEHAVIYILFSLGIGALILFLLITSIVVFAVKKHNHQNVRWVILSIIAYFVIGGIHLLFCASHQTDLRYNDWLIVGHKIEDVEKHYGPAVRRSGWACFDEDGHGYWMDLDKDGTVVSVSYGNGPWG